MTAKDRLSDMSTDFGKRIKAARKHAGLTQQELATRIEIAQASLSHLENSAFSSAYTVQIATACGIDHDWLATGEGSMVPAGGRVEAKNVTAMPAPTLRGLDAVLAELQAVVDGLSPLLQDAGRAVLHKWLDGQASRSDAVATLEGLRQASAGTMQDVSARAA
jgi:transcriptional regulator with XRE-family HTH domain